MNYLYIITNDFYGKLLKYYEEHDVNYLRIFNVNLSDKNVARVLNSIVNGTNNYFQIFNFSNANYLFDIDFIASHIEDGIYIKIPNIKNKNGNYQNLVDYKEFIKTNLKSDINETIIVRQILGHVILKMRLYYLDDFMKNNPVINEEKSILLKRLYNKLALMNDHVAYHNYDSYEDLIMAVHNHRLEIYDKISEIIDSKEIINEIIMQQDYYISEINRLFEEMAKKGNIMKIPDELFQIYCGFLQDFKKNAIIRRDNLINQRTKTISTFKF